MVKDVIFVFNKSDAINDTEITQELIELAYNNIAPYFKDKYGLDISLSYFNEHAHITSTYARTGIDEFLNDLVEHHQV
jgi:hypothetical protein